ncbi:MAG: ParB N-terminal domain-containing protein [Magnetococcales bacterium]|nr:ParB N-terminal domain-containing protein [Magnetococcales bacterium]
MNEKTVKLAFELQRVKIPLSRLMPTKQLPPNISSTMKYKQTEVSVREVGIIEALLVHPKPDDSGFYYLLDGHMRIQILDNMGVAETFCTLSTDDEGYIANIMVNRLNSIQEHIMVFQALQNGMSEEVLAGKLGMDVKKVKEKANLLVGISEEVADMLKLRNVPYATFKVLKKMNEYRQMEVVETMIAANDFSEKFANALLKLTHDDQLVERQISRDVEGMTPDQLARVQTELINLETEYKMAEESFADDLLTVTVFVGYLRKLLANERIVEYLEREYREIYQEFFSLTKRQIT